MNGLTIGRLAKQAGLGIETVRFYERQGLIDPPPRTDSNYRIYPEEEVNRLKFIKRAKDLGFTLKKLKISLNSSMIRMPPRRTSKSGRWKRLKISRKRSKTSSEYKKPLNIWQEPAMDTDH